MGFIRKSIVVIISVTLFIFLLLSSFLLIILTSLEYDNVHKEVVPFVKNLLDTTTNVSGKISAVYPMINKSCENKTSFYFETPQGIFNLSCDVVAEGSDAIFEDIVSKKIDEIYYKNYECKFFDCFKKEDIPLFLVSKHSLDYFRHLYVYTLIIVGLLFILLFLFVSNKSNSFIILGSLLLLVSLPFYKIILFFLRIINSGPFSKLFAVLLSNSTGVYLKYLIIGLLFLGVGAIMKLFSIGFKINSLIEKFFDKRKSNKEKDSEEDSAENNKKI